MKTALVIGSSGQDGKLLCRLLQSKGYRVTGLSRSLSRCWCDEEFALDVRDTVAVAQVVRALQPAEIYYLATYHRSSQGRGMTGAEAEASDTFAVNLHAYVAVLEAALRFIPHARLFYACSSLIYGEANGTPLTETTPARPQCLYGISKLAARQVSEFYRKNEGLHVSVGILFNHESAFRQDGFLSKRIVNGIRAVKEGASEHLVLGDLNAQCDWGYAGDFVEAMWRMLQLDQGCTYVVATGQLHSVRDWVEGGCALAGLRPTEVVREDPVLLTRRRPVLVGDSSRLRAATGWTPTVGFLEMIRKIYHREA